MEKRVNPSELRAMRSPSASNSIGSGGSMGCRPARLKENHQRKACGSGAMEKPQALPAEPHVVAAPSTLTVVAVILLASCASTARSPLCGEDGLQKGWLKIEQVSLPMI